MKVRYRGVRGSIPVPGAATSRYGGNSSCVELQVDGGPPLLLDCGTGARAAGRDIAMAGHRQVHVLFTHFHMDHLFGLPFFAPLYAPSCSVEIGVPAFSALDAENKLGRYLSGVYHPVRLGDFAARVAFRGVQPQRPFELGPYRVHPVTLNHPGGSVGYRVEAGGAVVVYLTDTAPLARPGRGLVDGKGPPGPERRVLDALREADLVIMDTMFSFEEFLEKMSWGHAYPEYGVALCEAAGAKRLALFHHAPDAQDAQLDALGARWTDAGGPVQVSLAREDDVLALGGASTTE